MPRLRYAVFRDRAVLTDSDTFEFSLSGLQGVSALDIVIRATNGATSNQGVPISTDIDKIEVVDGSKVIYSLSGVQARALNCYEMGRYPTILADERAAAVQEEIFRISFGRRVGDPLYWFDPARYANPMLRVTLSLTISATAGFATGTGRVSVIGHVWDQKPGGRLGCMIAKEYKSYTSVASGDDRANLPVDLPYRMLIVRAYETAIAWHTDITQVKLTLDNDSYVPLDVRAEQLRNLNAERFGLFRTSQVLFRTDADAPECFLAYPIEWAANALQDFDLASVDAQTIDQLTLQLITLAATPTVAKSTTDRAINLIAAGYLPHFAACIPFGQLDEPASWLSPEGVGKMELVLTQGGAGAAVSIFGQQVGP